MPSQVKENFPPTTSAQAGTSNQTTPVTGRSVGPLSLRSRRRLGRTNLPPPKRLKTSSQAENFHQKLDDAVKCGAPQSFSYDSNKLDVGQKLADCSAEQLKASSETGVGSVTETKILPLNPAFNQVQNQNGFTSGFKTAANKSISIAPKSLLKAKGMMAEIYSQDIQLESDVAKTDETRSSLTSGFKTAGNKAIDITPNSLERARGIMAEIYSQDILSGLDFEKPEVLGNSMTSGFKTAANKTVGINRNSMMKARGMMAEMYSQDIQLGMNSGMTDAQGSAVTSGFKTAADKCISITSNSVERARGMIAEIYSQEIQLKSSSGKPEIPGNSMTSGFTTASNKAISITQNSLQKASGMMAEIYSQEIQFQSPAVKSEPPGCSEGAVFPIRGNNADSLRITSEGRGNQPAVRFSSAGDKAVKVSAVSMAKAHMLMDEAEREFNNHDSVKKPAGEKIEDKDSSSTVGGLHSTQPPVDHTRKTFDTTAHVSINVGFSSASGKAISISAKAMQKAQTLMKSVDSELNDCASKQSNGDVRQETNDSSNVKKEPAVPLTVQFHSAGGKSLHISDASLQKAKAFMKDIHKISEDSIPPTVQFASASGKAVKISDGALDKARSFLSSGDSGISNSDTLQSIQFNSSSEVSNLSDQSFNKNDNVLHKLSGLTVEKHQQTPQAQQGSKLKKDYSKLPKGFRPFKPPARTTSSANSSKQPTHPRLSHRKVTVVPRNVSPSKICKDSDPIHEEVKITSHSIDKLEKTTLVNSSKLCSAASNNTKDKVEKVESPLDDNTKDKVEPPLDDVKPQTVTQDGFLDDGLSLSQAQQEIQAAEHMELMYAFMQAEEDSFTQDQGKVSADYTRNDKVQNEDASGTRTTDQIEVKVSHSGDNDGVYLDDGLMNEEDLHLIAKVDATHNGVQSGNGAKLTADSSQASQLDTSLNQGFMNSQNTVSSQLDIEEIDDRGTKMPCLTNENDASNLCESAKHVLKELQAMEKQLHLNPQDGVVSANIPKSSVHVMHDDDSHDGISSNKPPEFVGFQTGSGKRVTVSAESLTKAKHLFASVEAETSSDRDVQIAKGFQMASGKKVNVSKESLQRARELIVNDKNNPGASGTTSGGPDHESSGSVVPSQKFPVGFCTAGGNKVHVSDTSLKVAKQTLNKGASTSTFQSHRQETTNDDQSIPSFTGFQTAGGAKVKISEKSLQFAKKFLSEESICADLLPKKSNSVGSFAGFLTAGGATVKVSEKSLQFVKNFQSEESNGPDKLLQPSNDARSFAGFQTAGGNKVKVSEKSLQFAKNFLSEESISSDRQGDTAGSCIGFQTAAGKKVDISDDALQKAQQLLANTNSSVVPSRSKPTESEVKCSSPSSTKQGFKGFQTARGNKVHVSKQALDKARQFLTDNDNHVLQEGKPDTHGRTPPSSTGFVGFQTASGNKVIVSEESLERARSMLSEGEACTTEFSNSKQGNTERCTAASTMFTGFQTAGGSVVNISDESIQKAKKFLSEGDDVVASSNVQSGKPSAFGFQTASGNKVDISKDALRKAQQFLNQDDMSHNESGNPSGTESFTGFTTAAGGKVEVSEQSLKLAKSVIVNNEEHDFNGRVSHGLRSEAGMRCRQPAEETGSSVCQRKTRSSNLTDAHCTVTSSSDTELERPNLGSIRDSVVTRRHESTTRLGTEHTAKTVASGSNSKLLKKIILVIRSSKMSLKSVKFNFHFSD